MNTIKEILFNKYPIKMLISKKDSRIDDCLLKGSFYNQKLKKVYHINRKKDT